MNDMSSRDNVSIYRRRPKCPPDKEQQKQNENAVAAHLKTTAQVPSASTKEVKANWIDRSLLRSNTSTYASSRKTHNKAKQALASPNVYRKKRVEAPANFVREQNSYFEQVDAFELEEESPHAKGHWMPELEPTGAIAPTMHTNYKRLLQAVQEDSPEQLPRNNSMGTLSLHGDSLSPILQTPQSIQHFQGSDSRGSLQNFKQGLQKVIMPTRICYDAQLKQMTKEPAFEEPCIKQSISDMPEPIILNGKVQEARHSRFRQRVEQPAHRKNLDVAKELAPTIILSDDEKENFGTVLPNLEQSNPPSKEIQKLGPAGTRSTVLQIVKLDDSPCSLSKACNMHSTVASMKLEPAKTRSTVSQIINLDNSPCFLNKPCHMLSTVAPVKVEPAGTRAHVSPVMILDDSSFSLNKVCNEQCSNAPSVNHEYSKSDNIVSASFCKTETVIQKVASPFLGESISSGENSQLNHHHADQRLVDQIKNLHLQGSQDENCLEFSKPNNSFASKEKSNIYSSSRAEQLSTYESLLKICGQIAALPLEETIMQFSELRDVVKLGEGTYGEAFRTNNLVFKIVPMDGGFLVNGEAQKTIAEMHTEMLLTLTLNRFRKENSTDLTLQRNVCDNFIETKTVKVCQGLYGQELIKAWEMWGAKHESENDHPGIFPETQLYMLFVLADGGRDLESLSIVSFDVARSILIQVTVALAIAEEDCEFEHRDLHWGNILVASTESKELYCKLDGTDIQIKTYGILVHIIDFTLSRLFTGKEILFSNLSDDPSLFGGPRGDIQAEVYRKMLQLTEGQWEKRFLKTNCLWIHYLVEILLTRKNLRCTHLESRDLRAFKKRVLSYESARACLQDDFFATMKQEIG